MSQGCSQCSQTHSSTHVSCPSVEDTLVLRKPCSRRVCGILALDTGRRERRWLGTWTTSPSLSDAHATLAPTWDP